MYTKTNMSDTALIILGTVLGGLLLLFLLSKVRAFASKIANDTLKNADGKWSPTKLTMATAWFVVLWSYHYDLIKNGFNETAFMVLTGVALGAKVTDAWSKKMNPLVQPPKEDERAVK